MRYVAIAVLVLVVGLGAGFHQGRQDLAQRERAAIQRAEQRRELRARMRPELRAEACKYWSICGGGGRIVRSPEPGLDGVLAVWRTTG